MNVELFSVLDAAAGRYMDPFVAPTIEFALRGFREACTNADHQFAKYPEDYSLWHVGSFNGEMGVTITIEPKKLAIASAYVATGPRGVPSPGPRMHDTGEEAVLESPQDEPNFSGGDR